MVYRNFVAAFYECIVDFYCHFGAGYPSSLKLFPRIRLMVRQVLFSLQSSGGPFA